MKSMSDRTKGGPPLNDGGETSTLEIVSLSPEETQAIGLALGLRAVAGDVLMLSGELGAGKTCLTQGIVHGLGGEEYARSPTFLLVVQHRGRLTLYHIDLYRTDAAAEIDGLGLEEYLFGDGVCVVEWADKAPDIGPEDHLAVRMERVDETTRRLRLTGRGKRPAELIEAVRTTRGDRPDPVRSEAS